MSNAVLTHHAVRNCHRLVFADRVRARGHVFLNGGNGLGHGTSLQDEREIGLTAGAVRLVVSVPSTVALAVLVAPELAAARVSASPQALGTRRFDLDLRDATRRRQ